jgi:error-prone DNA polymerase
MPDDCSDVEELLAAVANRHEHPFRHPAVELHQPNCRRTRERLGELHDALGDRLSLAICRLYGENDSQQTAAVVELGKSMGIPLLATNAAYYHDPSRRMLQDVLTCVRHGVPIQQAGYRLFPNGERYLKSPEMMQRLFIDMPQAIRRGLEIADRCTFSLDELKYEYPMELAPEGVTPLQYLRQLSYLGAIERYTSENVLRASMPVSERAITVEEMDTLRRKVPRGSRIPRTCRLSIKPGMRRPRPSRDFL